MNKAPTVPVEVQPKPKRVLAEKNVSDRLLKAVTDVKRIMSTLPSDRHEFVLATVATLLKADGELGGEDAEETGSEGEAPANGWPDEDAEGRDPAGES